MFSAQKSIKNFALLSFIILLILTFINPQGLEAFPRKVLFEDFTSTTCGPCAQSAPEIEAAMQIVGENAAMVAFHMNWPAPGNDPWYAGNPEDANGRRGVYGVNAIPWLVIDGTRFQGSRTRQAISQAILARQQTPSPLRIDLNCIVINNELRVNARVTSEQNLNGLKLHLCLNELHYHYQGPSGQTEHYDAMIMMLPNHQGTQFNINANQTLEWNITRALPQGYWHELELDNLAVVAFVQNSSLEVLQTQKYLLGYNSPAVSIQDWQLVEPDEDGRAEPGETCSIIITVTNAPNYLMAEQINVRLSTQDDGISIINEEATFNRLAGGATVNNSNAPFQFRVDDAFEPHPVTFRFEMTVQPNDIQTNQEFTFMVGWPPFLLVDATNNQRASILMRSIFGQGNMPYADVWERSVAGVITYEEILNYPSVLWHSFNNNSDIISEFEAESLIDYLNNGGALIIASPYLGNAIGNHNLMRSYLGVEVANPSVGVFYVRGQEGDPDFSGSRIFLGGGSGAGFPSACASFTLRQGAQPIMIYHDAQGTERGIAAAKRETNTYRTLTFGYPLESIGGVQGTETFEIFMNRIWNWLQHPSSATDEPYLPTTLILEPAFPNPFNPNATIAFSLDRPGYIRLGLFDISGREIYTLLNGFTPSGRTTLILDAGKLGLTNGLYYIRLDTQGRSLMQKAIYLR